MPVSAEVADTARSEPQVAPPGIRLALTLATAGSLFLTIAYLRLVAFEPEAALWTVSGFYVGIPVTIGAIAQFRALLMALDPRRDTVVHFWATRRWFGWGFGLVAASILLLQVLFIA